MTIDDVLGTDRATLNGSSTVLGRKTSKEQERLRSHSQWQGLYRSYLDMYVVLALAAIFLLEII